MPDRAAPQDATLGELAVQLTEQTSRLVHDEVALAKAEIRESVKHAGIVESAAGKVRLLVRSELPKDWIPEDDDHATVWECL